MSERLVCSTSVIVRLCTSRELLDIAGCSVDWRLVMLLGKPEFTLLFPRCLLFTSMHLSAWVEPIMQVVTNVYINSANVGGCALTKCREEAKILPRQPFRWHYYTINVAQSGVDNCFWRWNLSCDRSNECRWVVRQMGYLLSTRAIAILEERMSLAPSSSLPSAEILTHPQLRIRNL